jgi:hypothetical protein
MVGRLFLPQFAHGFLFIGELAVVLNLIAADPFLPDQSVVIVFHLSEAREEVLEDTLLLVSQFVREPVDCEPPAHLLAVVLPQLAAVLDFSDTEQSLPEPDIPGLEEPPLGRRVLVNDEAVAFLVARLAGSVLNFLDRAESLKNVVERLKGSVACYPANEYLSVHVLFWYGVRPDQACIELLLRRVVVLNRFVALRKVLFSSLVVLAFFIFLTSFPLFSPLLRALRWISLPKIALASSGTALVVTVLFSGVVWILVPLLRRIVV